MHDRGVPYRVDVGRMKVDATLGIERCRTARRQQVIDEGSIAGAALRRSADVARAEVGLDLREPELAVTAIQAGAVAIPEQERLVRTENPLDESRGTPENQDV